MLYAFLIFCLVILLIKSYHDACVIKDSDRDINKLKQEVTRLTKDSFQSLVKEKQAVNALVYATHSPEWAEYSRAI